MSDAMHAPGPWEASHPYRTISIGHADPMYGGYWVWSCPCGGLDHGLLMVRHGTDANLCLRCGVAVDEAELEDFHRRGPLFRRAVAKATTGGAA